MLEESGKWEEKIGNSEAEKITRLNKGNKAVSSKFEKKEIAG